MKRLAMVAIIRKRIVSVAGAQRTVVTTIVKREPSREER